MNGGVKASLLVSCLALAGCTTATKEVKVRAIPDPSAVLSQGGDEIAVARGQFLLGNVGLALEGFRKAQRANPSDPAALAGIGDCYTVMGRFDIAQSNYEAALALAPHNHQLLLGLAAIFDQEGKPALAMAARAEAAVVPQAMLQSSTAPVVSAPVQKAVVSTRVSTAAPTTRELPPVFTPIEKPVEIPRPSIGSVTVELPPARPIGHVEARAAELPAANFEADASEAAAPTAPVQVLRPALRAPVEQAVQIPRPAFGAVTVALPPALPVGHIEALTAQLPPAYIEADVSPPTASLGLAAQVSAPGAVAPVEQTIGIPRPSLTKLTVDLPTPRPVALVEARAAQLPPADIEADVPAAAAVTVATVPVRPGAPRKPIPNDETAVAVALVPAPRLERLSVGEVALVTTGKPLWSAPGRVRLASTSSVRWVALSSPNPNVQVLNAARSQGLAASARTILTGRGWRRIAVGDAASVQHKSEVLYPRSHAALGRRLAAQFGVAAHMADRDNVVLILGRDAVDRITAQRRS